MHEIYRARKMHRRFSAGEKEKYFPERRGTADRVNAITRNLLLQFITRNLAELPFTRIDVMKIRPDTRVIAFPFYFSTRKYCKWLLFLSNDRYQPIVAK